MRMIGEGENERGRLRARWEELIVSSVGKCWVGLKEDGELHRMREGGERFVELERKMKVLVKLLARDEAERKKGERVSGDCRILSDEEQQLTKACVTAV